MSNTIINQSPRLNLSDPEQLDIGMRLRTINFKHHQQATPPFQATIFEVAPGHSSPLDQHAVKECWLILKGHGELQYNGKNYKTAAQDIFYFEPHHTHQITNESDELLIICSIYW